MPRKALRPCNQMGCPALVKRGYCERHRRERHARQNDARRADPARAALDREYKTTRWKRTRAAKLREDPLCGKCSEEGEVTAACEVDHRVPTAEGGAMYDWDNLQSLCRRHHREKSAREVFGRKWGAAAHADADTAPRG